MAKTFTSSSIDYSTSPCNAHSTVTTSVNAFKEAGQILIFMKIHIKFMTSNDF